MRLVVAPKPSKRLAQSRMRQVSERLLALGEFSHLRLKSQGPHILVLQPGPPQDPDDADPIARITALSNDQFGISFYSHDERWETMPFVGELHEVVSTMTEALAPFLVAEDGAGTCEMDN